MRRPPQIALSLLVALGLFAGCQPRSGGGFPVVPEDEPAEVAKEATPPPVFAEISLRSQNARVPVIMYHDLIAQRGRDSMWYDCTVAEFEQQMDWLFRMNAKPISLNELYGHLTAGTPVPPRAVVLTFDDNYQSFNDLALPILERYQFPAAQFVHTGFVGSKQGRPKMTWETLKTLSKNSLVQIASHTVNHFEDLGQRPANVQEQELKKAKETLEEKLGIPMDYLAYPVGSNSQVTRDLAKKLGYKMAFTIVNTPAEESPGILAVGRYVHTKLETAWLDAERGTRGGPAAVFEGDINIVPVSQRSLRVNGVKLALVEGGKPISLSSTTRTDVGSFVEKAKAVGGINGTYFDMAAIAGTSNKMVGPSKTNDSPLLLSDRYPDRWPKIRNRPLIMWSATKMAIVPFQPELMNSDEQIKTLMPDYTDLFLGGVWLVQGGVPRTKEDMNVFGSKDIQDFRRRAFMGIRADGVIVLGASTNSVSSERLAEAIADPEVGVVEAVLLDSGFSTSLVFNGQILASGHSTKSKPSRPVPHAIVLIGEIASLTDSQAPEVSVEGRPN